MIIFIFERKFVLIRYICTAKPFFVDAAADCEFICVHHRIGNNNATDDADEGELVTSRVYIYLIIPGTKW